MEIKKNPKSNLENFSKIFMQIGLVLALFVTYAAIEQKTYDKTYGDLGVVNMSAEMEEEVPITERIEPVKPKTPPPPTPELDAPVVDPVQDELSRQRDEVMAVNSIPSAFSAVVRSCVPTEWI